MDDQRTQYTLTSTDPKTGLVVRCVGVEYRDFPTVEWTVYFKNTGDKDTPILAELQAIDVRFVRPADGEFVLHSHKGDFCSPDSYRAVDRDARAERGKTVRPGGRAADQPRYPYFNVEMPGGGLSSAVGWPGQWAASSTRDGGTGLRIRAGQELTHFKLHAGRRGPHAADRAAVLEGRRLIALAKRLAALDARPQHAAARRQAARPMLSCLRRRLSSRAVKVNEADEKQSIDA